MSIASYSRPEIVVLNYSFVIHDGSCRKTIILLVGSTGPTGAFTVDGVKVTKESGLLYPNSFVLRYIKIARLIGSYNLGIG